jgi:cytochrome c peroxidase
MPRFVSDGRFAAMAQAQMNRDLEPEKVADIVAFLEALTSEYPTQTMLRLPPTPGDLLD